MERAQDLALELGDHLDADVQILFQTNEGDWIELATVHPVAGVPFQADPVDVRHHRL
jgi:hypothetical protein